MVYLLAAIGAVTVAVLMWRAFGQQAVGVSGRQATPPDDDPEFLRKLSEEQRKRKGDD